MQPDVLTLLEAIYALGDRLESALGADAVDTWTALLDERGALLTQLAACERPEGARAEALGEALRAQHRRLGEALAARERSLSEAMGRTGRFREARQAYGNHAPMSKAISGRLEG